MIFYALHIFRVRMKEFQSQVTLAKTNIPLLRSSIFIIAIDHLCPENSVIIVITLFQVKLDQPPKKTDKAQIDLTKVTTKGKLPCQEKHFLDQTNIKLSSIFK